MMTQCLDVSNLPDPNGEFNTLASSLSSATYFRLSELVTAYSNFGDTSFAVFGVASSR